MSPTVLVVTTVHWPDDTRIRERLIRTLATEFSVTYAAKGPGPADRSDLRFIELPGGRLRRNISAMTTVLRQNWDILVVHDPELIVTALMARLTRRRPVVFDVHEDYTAVVATRGWVVPWLRAPMRLSARLALRAAERFLDLTLAEAGYTGLFRSRHPVFENYPDTSRYPAVQGAGNRDAVYLGDATTARGVDVAIEACARAGIPLRLIGRVSREVEAKAVAWNESGAHVRLDGLLPNPIALEKVARASVGLVPLLDLPNYRHSQPTKLLEYLALGVPVVVSDLPGTRDLADDLEAVLFVEPGDPEAMADAVLVASSEEHKELAVGQAQSIRERFRWPEGQVRRFYAGLLGR